MEHSLKHNLLEYFQKIEKPTEEEQKLLNGLQSSCEYFDISCIHRDDIKDAGYDGDKLDDAEMEKLADKMDDYYLEYGYHEDLELACEKLEIPKLL